VDFDVVSVKNAPSRLKILRKTYFSVFHVFNVFFTIPKFGSMLTYMQIQTVSFCQ